MKKDRCHCLIAKANSIDQGNDPHAENPSETCIHLSGCTPDGVFEKVLCGDTATVFKQRL